MFACFWVVFAWFNTNIQGADCIICQITTWLYLVLHAITFLSSLTKKTCTHKIKMFQHLIFFQVNKIHDPLNVANHYNMALAWIKRLERFHLRLVYLYHLTLTQVKVILVSDHLLTDKHIIHTILHLTTVTSLSQNSSEWHLEAMQFHKNINHLGFCFTQLEI